MELRYFLIISSAFDRTPIVLDHEPTEQEIKDYIIKLKGTSARIEKRYVLSEK